MKSLAYAVILCAGMPLQGCSLVLLGKDVERTDLSSLQMGAARADVESVLGQPTAHEPLGSGSIDTYRYDRGAPGSAIDDGTLRDYVGLYGPFWEPILTPVALAVRLERIKRQKGRVKVTFDADDRVVDYIFDDAVREAPSPAPVFDAEPGDAEAQYRFALRAPSAAEKWKWMCRAANRGHADAQFHLGSRARARADDVQAYKWYGLSEAHGSDFAADMKNRVAKAMTPSQIAEAERLVRAWRPDPEACDTEPVIASSAG